ncbi:TRAP transporter large permease [Chloroflexota bacterium]
MDMAIIGTISIFTLIVLFLIGVPVAYAMAIIGVIGFSYVVSTGAGLSMLAIEIFDNFAEYSLTVVPTFVLMGSLAFAAGITKRLYDAGYTLFGRMRGGLAISTIAACAGFAAICGSTNATAAAMGKVALPEMKRYNYDDGLATGCVASAGSLGILIPPSTILIIYGIMTEQSIGKLFIAGVLPGILLAILFMIAVFLRCWKDPAAGPAGPSTTMKQKLIGLSGLSEMGILFGLVMGGLFAGWFTPTEAGGAGAAGALLIAVARRSITWQGLIEAFKDTLLITCMVLTIVTGALIFGRFMTVTHIPFMLSDWVGGLPISPLAVMALIILIHFIGGCFMDAFALIVLTIPIVFPVVTALGFDPIWFGVLIVLICEMGVITPPVGINVYVIKGVAPDVPLTTIFKGVIPFVIALVIGTTLLTIFPQIATFLPSFMSY